MASKLGPLRCCICQSLPSPPPDYEKTRTPFVYHCDAGHITCIRCVPSPSAQDDNEPVKSDKVKPLKSLPCSKCDRQMDSCRISSVLMARMLFECPHRFAGCMISLNVSNYDTHVCGHSTYPCLFCEFTPKSVAELSAHLNEIHPTIRRYSIVPKKRLFFDVTPGETILFQDKEDLLVLRFENGHLFLQTWDKHRRHSLLFYLDDEGVDHRVSNYLGYDGNTSKVKDKTPVIESIKVPLTAFDHGIPVGCSLKIESLEGIDENPAIALVIGLTDEELKDMECQICLQRVQPLFTHCVYDHPLCINCLRNLLDKGMMQGICFCKQKFVHWCDLGRYIMRNSQFSCLNQESSRCDRQDLYYGETTDHGIECSKPFCCPVCLMEFFTTMEELKVHLEAVHAGETREITATEESEMVVSAGCNLVREVGGVRDYFVVVYEDGKICVQHFEGTAPRNYYVRVIVTDKGEILTWTQGAVTTQVEKKSKPTLSDQCIVLPPASASNEYLAAIVLNINVPRDQVHDDDEESD